MYIAYVYDTLGAVIAQLVEILDFETTIKINGVSTASLSLYHDNPYCKREFIKEYRRIIIKQELNGYETTMFDGVIRGFEADMTKVKIKCESFEHYFERRLLPDDYTINNTVDNILSTILTAINGIENTGITLDCGVLETTPKEYKRGESFLKVLQDLAGLGYEFLIVDKVLKFKSTVGIDRTTGDDFVIYKYDINEPTDRSIDNIKFLTDGKNLANGVLVRSDGGFTYLSDATSKTEFGLVETSLSNSGDQAGESQAYLDLHKDSVGEYQVSGVTQDFFEADIGDLVSVYIYVGNDVLFYDGPMKVTEKRYIAGDLPTIDFKLGASMIKSKDFIEEIVDLQRRIKTLEFK